MTEWVVHKFGGTSVANADRYRAVGEIIRAEKSGPKAVVVSAMAGMTNGLIELVELASRQDPSYEGKFASLKKKPQEALEALFPDQSSKVRGALSAALAADFKDLQELLRGVWLAKGYPELTVELISGYGELWSAQLLNAQLNSMGFSCAYLDARKVLIVETVPGGVLVDWLATRAKFREWLDKTPAEHLVITGFVASTKEGMATTLKRNGSDFSASIFGALLKASAIVIWTDVNGVLSADPRLVPEAQLLTELSYDEATELAYFGAKVVHPSTMAPAIEDQIPIWIKNAFNPKAPGTCIHAHVKSDVLVKGFATIDNMALINVEGTGMIGVPGVAQRLFGALQEIGVSVVMISQASSEHSICFAISQTQAERGKKAIEKAFFAELHHGVIQKISVSENCTVIAAVGENMAETPGVAAKFFNALGNANVSVKAIAQGSSERNISAVISGTQSVRALRAVHSAFFLSPQTLSIGLIGSGLIGGTFLDQLNAEMERLRRDFKFDLRVRGILNSKKMYLGNPAIDLATWREDLKKSEQVADLGEFVKHVNADHLPHAVFIDATASDVYVKSYVTWLEQGLHVITPNKKASSASFDFYRRLVSKGRKRRGQYSYSTTVGGGLPIINTLRDLIHTGDEIIEIQGILSGTLSYLFNSFSRENSFSQVVNEARKKGFTEPDPREDLSGMDVARKLVILAREMGMPVEIENVEVENLVPTSDRGGTVDEWLAKLPKNDAAMEMRRAEAEKKGQVLRYVGVIQPPSKCSVRLMNFPKEHPFAGLAQSDNIVTFRTKRYSLQPLIIRGPGAGPDVTAAGVFADVLRLTSTLGGES